ncbi:MAG: hypothetical protein JXR40_02590 [Pontiellaceae bacterium]|nr:hypothetical protein [Pontiellaceae bacterium]
MKHMYSHSNKKADKGAPSGFIVSLIFHAAVFFAAGVFVVYSMVKPKPFIFTQPENVERPVIDYKKPVVRVKSSSSPEPASHIVSIAKTAKMPEVSIPDLTGNGEGLLDGMGGDFGNTMGPPDASTIPKLFGDGITTGKDLQVTFYSMGRASSGAKRPISHQEYFSIIADFVEKGWDTSLLNRYYHSPRKLYASCIAIPSVSSIVGPLSFRESAYLENARCWAAHYRGTIKHKDGITFRFWGASDDVLTVALNKEVVLAANFPWDGVDAYLIASDFDTSRAPGSRSTQSEDDGMYPIGNVTMVGSDWITLKPGETYDFDAVAGEGPGGGFFAMLMVEIQGEEYATNDRGGKVFPLFATQPLSWEVEDSILMNMNKGDCQVTDLSTHFVTE